MGRIRVRPRSKNNLLLSFACIALLDACATSPIATDALPQLKPGEGIAGISFDSTWELRSVMFQAASGNGPKLRVPEVPSGQSAFLFVVPAGNYCLEEYTLNSDNVSLISKQEDRCFDVEAGKLSYSGTFVPQFGMLDAIIKTRKPMGRVTRQDTPRAFLNALSLNYPHISAAAFPTGSDKSVSELAPPAPPPSGRICTLLTQDEAANVLGKPVQAGTEFNMGRVDACNFMHSDDESVHVIINSTEGRAALFKGVGNEASATGATEWISVPSLGDKAAFGCKKDNCEIDILWKDRVLALVVDGNERKDIAEALTALAQHVVPRWQAAPSTGVSESAQQQ